MEAHKKQNRKYALEERVANVTSKNCKWQDSAGCLGLFWGLVHPSMCGRNPGEEFTLGDGICFTYLIWGKGTSWQCECWQLRNQQETSCYRCHSCDIPQCQVKMGPLPVSLGLLRGWFFLTLHEVTCAIICSEHVHHFKKYKIFYTLNLVIRLDFGLTWCISGKIKSNSSLFVCKTNERNLPRLQSPNLLGQKDWVGQLSSGVWRLHFLNTRNLHVKDAFRRKLKSKKTAKSGT